MEIMAIAKRVAIENSNSGTLNCSRTSPSIEAWAGTTSISDSTNTMAGSDDITLFMSMLNGEGS